MQHHSTRSHRVTTQKKRITDQQHNKMMVMMKHSPLLISLGIVSLLLGSIVCEVTLPEETVVERNLVSEKVTYNSILKEHKRPAEHSPKAFDGKTLAYVTPW
eukprot:TRINITY_DN5534_c0_g1_i1.p2 TRINITY_DN5534_c0_g1~~TRINITY_DN5534_c0_g1_i1.p2  ORF type:complete len:102 (+),score=16.77 TRINITY_DN5534_c0_g1_i1:105-410(+)